MIDISKLPDADLHAEVARRRSAKRKTFGGGGKPILTTCACGREVNARERWAGCPNCGAHNRKKGGEKP